MADRLAYSVPEAAALLGVSESTVRSYISTGALTAAQPLGKASRVLIPATSIYALLTPSEPVTA